MKYSGFLYNNEALGSVVLADFMSRHEVIEPAKLLLVLPFVLHEPTTRQLKSRSYKRSLEEFIIKNIDCVMNFSSRFEDYLPLSINCITILLESKLLVIDHENLRFNDPDELFDTRNNSNLGIRANEIFKANDALSSLMKIEQTNSFYLKLRIAL